MFNRVLLLSSKRNERAEGEVDYTLTVGEWENDYASCYGFNREKSVGSISPDTYKGAQINLFQVKHAYSPSVGDDPSIGDAPLHNILSPQIRFDKFPSNTPAYLKVKIDGVEQITGLNNEFFFKSVGYEPFYLYEHALENLPVYNGEELKLTISKGFQDFHLFIENNVNEVNPDIFYADIEQVLDNDGVLVEIPILDGNYRTSAKLPSLIGNLFFTSTTTGEMSVDVYRVFRAEENEVFDEDGYIAGEYEIIDRYSYSVSIGDLVNLDCSFNSSMDEVWAIKVAFNPYVAPEPEKPVG